MQLSKNKNIICNIFIKFLKFTLNFEHFEKKKPHSLNIFQIIDSDRLG